MKSFNQFIVEGRMTTHAEIAAAVAAAKKAGEILNPAYQDLVDQAKRVMRNGSFAHKPEKLLDLVRAEHGTGKYDDDLNDLYYTSFDSFASHNKIEKLVNKLDKKNNPKYAAMLRDVRQYLKDWKQIGEDLKAMKSKVVKVTQKRAEAKAEAEKVLTKKKADSSALIKIFESHMAEYIAMARKRAKEFIDQKIEILKSHGWDIDKVAPSPSINMGSTAYQMAKAKRSLYTSITKSKSSYLRRGEPDIREVNHTMVERYIEMSAQGAEESYRAFMAKMMHKIGKTVVDAKMTGNIWTNAIITVTCDDGEEQVWHTKMILNFSKYARMFNQFPSRRKR